MASIFSIFSSTGPKPKTHVSHGTLPPFIDPKQPPTKKSPWRQIQSTPFISSLAITLPTTLYKTIAPHLHTSIPPPQYAKLILTLTQILTGPFFTTYIKTGNVLMISEGQPGISAWFATLRDGTLKLEMTRELYERCGLQGMVTERNGGARKHGRDRWTVELDLRAPSMVRGKKGFERLVRAAEEVLSEGRVWLFRDLRVRGKGKPEEAEGSAAHRDNEDVLPAFHPTVMTLEPQERDMQGVLVPAVVSRVQENPTTLFEFQDDYYELIEWLDLVHLASPRVLQTDDPDPYISRYSVLDADTATPMDLKVLTWTGLLDNNWCVQLLIDIIRLTRKANAREWLAFTFTSHRTEALGQTTGSMTLLQPGASATRAEQDDQIDVDGPSNLATQGEGTGMHGLQRFLCFEFVDSIRI